MEVDLPVILLVEDEPLVRIFTGELLTEAGFKVLEAANASEALTILGADLTVSVLLSDVDMPPGVDGYELARTVHERWPTVEILVMSGRQWPQQGDLPEGAAFLGKPVPNEVLVSYVQAAAARAAAGRGLSEDNVGEGTVIPFPSAAGGR
jgi:CheY-like chemotaxis protein